MFSKKDDLPSNIFYVWNVEGVMSLILREMFLKYLGRWLTFQIARMKRFKRRVCKKNRFYGTTRGRRS